ncbi:MAG: hypothetical protein ACLUFF_00515, partial [Acutalibacteraceae bacterium]
VCSYAENKELITKEDVQAVASQTLEANAFAIVDLLLQGKRERVARQMDLLFEDGGSVQMFMGAVAYRLRQLLAARQGWEEGKSLSAAAAKVQGPVCSKNGNPGKDDENRNPAAGLGCLDGGGFCH